MVDKKIQPAEKLPVLSTIKPNNGGPRMTPHDPIIMLSPLAAPDCTHGTSSVAAFIHTPLNPAIQKPNMNVITVMIANEVPAGSCEMTNEMNPAFLQV